MKINLAELADRAHTYLFHPPAGRCPCCGSENGTGERCGKCAAELERLKIHGGGDYVAPYYYSGIARSMVVSVKFLGAAYLAPLMAEEIAAVIPPADLITFVPLHPSKKRRRGFNQSELIAKELSRVTGIPCEALTRRIRRTRAQSLSQSAEKRAENMRGAFEALPHSSLSGRTVILIDDVITTGSTIRECAAALEALSPRKIILAAFTLAEHEKN